MDKDKVKIVGVGDNRGMVNMAVVVGPDTDEQAVEKAEVAFNLINMSEDELEALGFKVIKTNQ